VFWTTTQLLTVSSQIKNPISAGGRVLDVFREIWAVTVIATLAGALGSFLQKRGQEIDEKRGRGGIGAAARGRVGVGVCWPLQARPPTTIRAEEQHEDNH
jgi:hypothetical protein